MGLDEIQELVEDDMRAVNDVIRRRLRSDVVMINELGQYIVNSGGKRVRPLLVLLSAKACGYTGTKHIEVAAIVEFIHTATLLHDDVVDDSQLRRGHQTANMLWGNEAAVLVGDFLYSRAFEMMVNVGSMRVMEILAHTTNTIAEGEVLQLLNCHDADTSEARYMEVIQSKTAKLFEAASQLGAVLAQASEEAERCLAAYGLHLGMAFQLIDDALDYRASAEQIGKNVGDDLAEGKPTLPLIHAIHNGTRAQASVIRHAVEQGGRDSIIEVLQAIESTGAIAYTDASARRESELALAQLTALSETPYTRALSGLARFSVERDF